MDCDIYSEGIWYISKTNELLISEEEHIFTLLKNYKKFGLSDDDIKEYLEKNKKDKELIQWTSDLFIFNKARSKNNIRLRKIIFGNIKRILIYDEKNYPKLIINMLLDNSDFFKGNILCFEGQKEFKDIPSAINYLSSL